MMKKCTKYHSVKPIHLILNDIQAALRFPHVRELSNLQYLSVNISEH